VSYEKQGGNPRLPAPVLSSVHPGGPGGNAAAVARIQTPAEIEIHWGGKVFRFPSETEALKAGFHLK
jgi:hypothetical protein